MESPNTKKQIEKDKGKKQQKAISQKLGEEETLRGWEVRDLVAVGEGQ